MKMITLASILLTALFSPCASGQAGSTQLGSEQSESDYYVDQKYVPPKGAIIEVGGMDFLDANTLLVSTRRGQVWWIDDALAEDPKDAKWHLYAEGLYEGLGLTVVGKDIYVVQRGELSKLVDNDGDKVCDEIVTITQDWGMTGNYHEFAFGLPRDAAGNFYISLNVGFWSPEWWHGRSQAPYRGWIMQITPEGVVKPFASGVRSPCGLGMNSQGDLFYTDNQGDWMAVCPIYHVEKGAFFGHPASQRWTPAFGNGKDIPSTTEPLDTERHPAAIWLPYKWSRSTGNLVEDSSAGKFGPFAGQMFAGELTNGMVLRTQMEKVRGQYQGAVFLFRQELGSICRVGFAPDKSMIVGYTNRGWGGRGPSHGLGRIRWTGKTPFDMHSVHLKQDGFEITLTEAVASDLAGASVEAELYDYNYWWDYGSPVQNQRPVEVIAIEPVGSDGKKLFVRMKGLEPARCIKVVVKGLKSVSGKALLHDEFHYTINQMPEGPLTTQRINRKVAPPAVKSSDSDGWLHLTWGDATGLWKSDGWALVDVDLDEEDPAILHTRPGMGALVNNGERPDHFTTKAEFGDYEFRFKFMLPKKGDSGLYFMKRYELQLADNVNAVGGIHGVQQPRRGSGAYRGHGDWHTVTGRFRAPKFDTTGKKIKNAQIEAVSIDDVLVMAMAQPEGPTGGGEPGEVARAALLFQGDTGKVCLGDIRVKPLDDASLDGVFSGDTIELLSGADLKGWTSTGDAKWTCTDGVLRAKGGAGRLETDASDWTDFELRLKLAVNEGGNAGLRFGWDGKDGYEAEINCSPSAVTQTGSLVGFEDIQTDLIPGGVRFDYVIRQQRTAKGTEISLYLNGVRFAHHIDTSSQHTGGKLALEIGPNTELTIESFTAQR